MGPKRKASARRESTEFLRQWSRDRRIAATHRGAGRARGSAMACSQAWRSSALAGLARQCGDVHHEDAPDATPDVDITAGSYRAAMAENDRSVRAVGGQARGILDQREPEAPTHAGPDFEVARLPAGELGHCFRAENTRSGARPAPSTEHHLVERRDVRCRGEPPASGARDPLRAGWWRPAGRRAMRWREARTGDASSWAERGGVRTGDRGRRTDDGGRRTED